MRKIIAIAAVVLAVTASQAQTSGSAYFLEGFSQRYQMNPAFAPERDLLLAVPTVSNVQFGFKGSAGLSDFIFESKDNPGKLTTFMSSEIGRDEFLNGLPDATQFNATLNMDLLTLGVGGEKGYTVFNVKLRSDEVLSIPKEMFAFMKAGLSNGTYRIENINFNSISYAEFSLNHSHRINDNLRVGATVKLLAGLDYADLTVDAIDADLAQSAWSVRTNGSFMESVPGGKVKYNETDKTIDGMDYEFNTPESFGVAVDLGAEYDFSDLVEGLKVSASLTDLGAIGWKNVAKFVTDNDEYVTFDGFHNYNVMSKDDDIPEADQVEDDFKDMVKLYQDAMTDESKALKATVRLGAEYTMPMADWLKFGELLTLRTGLWSYFESRSSVNMAPCTWFDVSGNLAFTTYGTQAGLVANLHPAGFNLFFACDCFKARLNRQFIPLDDFGIDLSVGLSLALGQKRSR